MNAEQELLHVSQNLFNTWPTLARAWSLPFKKAQQLHEQEFNTLEEYLPKLYSSEKVYPSVDNLFRAYELRPQDIKVVILGQDPYHNGHADGLAFSTTQNGNLPESLKNIFKLLRIEFGEDYKIKALNGDLTDWHKQGVFLLNTRLTVLAKNPCAPMCDVWKDFITETIKTIAQQSGVVFVLWGREAQKFKKFLNPEMHHIIETSHPSPLSVHRGFLKSNCFTRINDFLVQEGKVPIEW